MSATRRGVAIGCAIGLASGWNVANLGAMASDLADAYGIGLAVVGLFTTALFITHTGMQVPGGRVADRCGPVRAALAGLSLIAVSDLIALTAAEPAVALVARTVTGVGTGLTFIAGNALVRESGGSPFAQGLYGGIGLGGGGLALAIVPGLEGALDWRAPYWSSLGLAAAGIALLALAPRRAAGAPRATAATARSGVLRDERLYRLALLYTCSYGLGVLVANWVTELLERHTGMSDSTAGVIGALTLLLGIVTRPFGGWLMRRHPDLMRPGLVAGLAAGAAGTVVLVVGGSVATGALGAFLIGAGSGMSFAPAFTGAALTRPDAPSAAVGFVNMTANFVVLVGTPLVGLTFSLPGDGRIGFLVIAAGWLVAAAALPSRRSLGVAPA